MIVYLDADALRSLYVVDGGSDQARAKVTEGSIVATSVMAYPEVMAAFADLHQRGAISAKELKTLRSELERDWPHYLKLELTEPVWRRAGQLAANYVLSGSRAIHVASYLVIAADDRARSAFFWSPDERARLAARTVETAGT